MKTKSLVRCKKSDLALTLFAKESRITTRDTILVEEINDKALHSSQILL